MRNALMVSGSLQHISKFKRLLSKRTDIEITYENTFLDIIKVLHKKQFHSIFIDIDIPIIGVHNLVRRLIGSFPDIDRIILRGEEYSVTHRKLLDISDISIVSPDSISEVDLFICQINKFFPIKGKVIKSAQSTIVSHKIIKLYNDVVNHKVSLEAMFDIIEEDRELLSLVMKGANTLFGEASNSIVIPARAIRLLGFNGLQSLLEDTYSKDKLLGL